MMYRVYCDLRHLLVPMPDSAGGVNRLSMECFGMKRYMIANEGGDEVVAMIKPRLESKREGMTDGFAGVL